MQENNLLNQVLRNLDSIKKLENDNKKLQELILKSQDSKILKKKVDDLLYLLGEKDKNLRIIEEKIKNEHGRIIFELKKRYDDEKEANSRLQKKILLLSKYVNENKRLKVYISKLQFIMKKEYEKKLNDLNDGFLIYKEKHKSILKDAEEHKLGFRKNLEIERKRNEELAEINRSLYSRIKELESKNEKLTEMNKKIFYDYTAIKEVRSNKEKEIEERKKSVETSAKNKVNEIAKEFLEKEIEYRARIESLNNDLKSYIEQLNDIKSKYYRREKELKEKFKELF